MTYFDEHLDLCNNARESSNTYLFMQIFVLVRDDTINSLQNRESIANDVRC